MASIDRLCPVCGKRLEMGASPIVCPACQTLYHAECWDTIKSCLAFGCKLPTSEAQSYTPGQRLKVECSSCHKENSPSSQCCLNCGRVLGEALPERKIFVSCGGWTADTPEELIENLGSHWESSVQHLYLGDIEYWLTQEKRPDLAQKAKEARLANVQKSVGLEAFLQSTGMVEKPKMQLSTHTLVMESASSVIESVVNVSNVGRGYLSGTVKSDVDWITLDSREFTGNKARIVVTVDVSRMPTGSSKGHVIFSGVGGEDQVEILAKRISIREAVESYEQRDFSKTRSICRRLLETRMSSADAVVLTAACCLEDDDTVGAVASLRKLSGACQLLTNEIINFVYSWIKEEDNVASGIDRLMLFEAFLPCAEGELKEKLKKDIGQEALALACSSSGAVGSSGTSLWRSGKATSHNIRDLLQLAESSDPSLKEQVQQARRVLSSSIAKGRLVNWLWCVAMIILVVGIGAGAWYLWTLNDNSLTRTADGLIAKGDYPGALQEMRVVYSNNPDDMDVQVRYVQALIYSAKEAYSRSDLIACEASLSIAFNALAGRTLPSKEAARMLLDWALELEKSGNLGEARIRVEQALKLDSENSSLLATQTRLAADTDLYYSLFELAESSIGSRAVINYIKDPTLNNDNAAADSESVNAKQVALLRKLGVELYNERMMIAFSDVLGKGARDLVVAGTQVEGKAVEGRYAIYQVTGSALKKVYSNVSRQYPLLSSVAVYNLSGSNRGDVAMIWTPQEVTSDKCQTLLVASVAGRFVFEAFEGNTQPAFTDRDLDKRFEIWRADIVAESTGPADRVFISKPYLWKEPGLEASQDDYSAYYRECIKMLREQIAKNPYVAEDPRRVLYSDDRQKAIVLIEQLLK